MRKYLVAVVLAAFVALVVDVGMHPRPMPSVVPADGPASVFSARRALVVLREIAGRPRPLGGSYDARARDVIVARLRGLGLTTDVEAAPVASAWDVPVAGTVHNVVARLPGSDSTRSVLLVAHYDSVPVAPGAADDGAGVATLLETARALTVGRPLRNDVVFLFTDGEEEGLMGARAFLRQSALAYGVGVVVNFDGPGASSPALMYQTSVQNGWLVRQFAAASRYPFGSSLTYEVSRRVAVETDFKEFLRSGYPGLSFAMLDGPAHNHTGYDTVRNVRLPNLQHQGDIALSLARRLGGLDLWRVRSPNVVYFNPVGWFMVVYSQHWVLPIAGLGLALLGATVAIGFRKRRLTLRGVALGFVVSPLAIALALSLTGLAWAMFYSAYIKRNWSDVGVVISDLYRLGLVLVAAAASAAIHGMLLRRIRASDLAVACLGWWAVLTVVVSIVFAGASFLVSWPLIFAAIGLGVALFVGDSFRDSLPSLAALSLGAIPGILLVSSSTYVLLMSAGLQQVVTVVAVWLVCGLLVAHIDAVLHAFGKAVPAVLALAGVIVLMSVGSTVASEVVNPHFDSVFYRLDGDHGTAVWQTTDWPPDTFTQRFLTLRPRLFAQDYVPWLGVQDTISSTAPALALAAPRIVVLSDAERSGVRTIRLRLVSPPGVAIVSLAEEAVVGQLSSWVEGQVLPGSDTTALNGTPVRWAMDYFAPSPAGVEVTLRCMAGRSLRFVVQDFAYGLPPGLALSALARPHGMLPGGIGDGTIVARTYVLGPKAGSALRPAR